MTAFALVIDDETSVSGLVARALRAEGFVCDTAADGEEGKRRLGHKRYDVLVTDLRMPKMNGHALVLEVLAGPRPPLVVVLTGVIEPRLVRDLIGRGVTDVVQKPTDFKFFASKVASFHRRGPGTPSRRPAPAPDLAAQIATIQEAFRRDLERIQERSRAVEGETLAAVRVLSGLLERVGPSAEGHVARVERLAAALAAVRGIDPSTTHALRVASLLHEIGRDPGERIESGRAPLLGAALLAGLAGPSPLASILESHAENWDGSGVPDGRRGTEIPIEGRILRLADGLDTHLLRSGSIGDLEAAREHLADRSATHYDPGLVDQAIAVLEREIPDQSSKR